jgi:signal transduction histidine kinase
MPEGVVLEIDLPSPGPVIRANANQIEQVLANLVTNAREALGDGRGANLLTVKAYSRADIPAAHRFPLDWQPQDTAYACLEVADTGCGIADKDIENLFDPFFSSKFTGRGLGLAVVLGIVRAHEGAVTVESEPGHGSVFRVFFPVSAESNAGSGDPAYNNAGSAYNNAGSGDPAYNVDVGRVTPRGARAGHLSSVGRVTSRGGTGLEWGGT